MPHCKTLVIAEAEDERLNMSNCTACYRSVCEHCHRHTPGSGEDDCLCKSCARKEQDDRAGGKHP